MREHTCCITGQQLAPEEDIKALKERLAEVIGQLLEQDVTNFLLGGSPGFELLAGAVLLEKRMRDPRITLTVILPHKDATKGWRHEDIVQHGRFLKQADEVFYTSYSKEKGCVQQRNRCLVNNSSVCLCYLNRKVGGVWYTVLLSIRKGLKIINLRFKDAVL